MLGAGSPGPPPEPVSLTRFFYIFTRAVRKRRWLTLGTPVASPRVQVFKAQPKRANGVAGIQGARRSVAAARQTLAHPNAQPTRSSRLSFRPADHQTMLSPQRPRASRQSARRSMLAPLSEQREASFVEHNSSLAVPQAHASRQRVKKQSMFGQTLDVTRRQSSRRSTVAPGVVQQTTTTALAPAAQDLFLILACGAVHDLMDLNTYVRPRPPP